MKPRRKPTRPGDRASQRAQTIARCTAALKAQQEQERRQRIEQANAEFASQMTTARMRIYFTQDGEDATELLSQLAIAIGTPAEAGARTFGRDPAWVRQMHGALRTILDMCLHNGYRWRSDMADPLDRAMDLAMNRPEGIHPEHFIAAFLEAQALAVQILNHTVTEGAIA